MKSVSPGGTWPRAAKSVFLVACVFAAACSSIVDDPCATGYRLERGVCVAAAGPGPDAGDPGDATDPDGGIVVTDPDGGTTQPPDGGVANPPGDGGVLQPPDPPDPLVCGGADLETDPGNCGTCGHACASGICEAGRCLGELPGQIIVIGHDYRRHNSAMARVLGNAAALGVRHDLAIARLHGTVALASRNGTSATLAEAMASIGRSWHAVTIAETPSPGALAEIDVLIVDAQTDPDAAFVAGTAWASELDDFLHHSGVIVVLEGAAGGGHRFAEGAVLVALPAPIEITGSPAFVADAGDAVVQQVVTPYLADSTSVVFPGTPGPIATPGGAIVVHHTRY